VSISSTFFARIFCTKVRSKPNSKQRKDFCVKNAGLKCWWNRHLVSISATIYGQLLCSQIPKAHKNSQVVSLFALLGSVHVKAAHRTLMKFTPGKVGHTFVGETHCASTLRFAPIASWNWPLYIVWSCKTL